MGAGGAAEATSVTFISPAKREAMIKADEELRTYEDKLSAAGVWSDDELTKVRDVIKRLQDEFEIKSTSPSRRLGSRS